ncbi:MAG: Gfo/Idh/MocA family oxidoreductase [Kiritimatiellae bacterium]|nr:Gfo/Idh/MocA family oxidoreductase [Kiritimatiellia bacterium]
MRLSRRNFVATAAAFAGFPFLRAAAASPNGKVNMAFVGIGHQARNDFNMFAYYKDLVNVVAFCDTQMGADHTLDVLKAYPNIPRYHDFRKMLDEHAREIDAVCIATPDFAHFPAAMLAMSMGKAVYCEKPMGNCFREVALMMAAAKKYKVVTQMGNQGHSDANYWQMKTLVEKGCLKDAVHMDAYMCANNRRWFKWNGTLTEMPGEESEPAEMEWDIWLSQRPFRPFNHNFINGDWRCFYEYGTGALGDWGAHLFDAAHEFLKLGLPCRIETVKNDRRTPVVFPMASTVRYVFPARGEGFPEFTLDWHDGAGNFPKPVANVTDRKWQRKTNGAELHLKDGRVFARGSHGSPLQLIAGADPRDADVKAMLKDFPKGKSGHYLNFLKAVKGEEPANSDFAVAGPLSQVMALGALAQRLAAPKLEFDLKTQRFVGSDEANALLDGPPVRKGWEEFEKLGA